MAVFTPLLIISLIATAGSTVIQMNAQQQAADDQAAELERRKEEERVAAEGEELARREQSNKILAQQIAATAGSGIGFEGSPEKIAQIDAENASLGDLGGTASLSGRTRSLTNQANSARRIGNLKSMGTFLGGVGSMASMS